MTLTPRWRKAVLTAHVATSVGWLGAVTSYLVLDFVASLSGDAVRVRSAYVAMELIVDYAIVPLALAALVIGILNALGTSWGLFQHHWVVMKLLLTLMATTILLIETPTIAALADTSSMVSDPTGLPGTLPHSVGGLVILVLTTLLSVYKPRGLTRRGWRRRQGTDQRSTAGLA